ncbi:hypothetical protein [Actinoplanes sp. NPDC049265]|uniref:hypothetical protein n=1 Tax=Actinoplanes sp. NPDC049265 TaxID=3363902 RepID=UPI00371F149D
MGDAETFAEIADPTPPAGVPVRLGTAVVLGGSMAGMLAARGWRRTRGAYPRWPGPTSTC